MPGRPLLQSPLIGWPVVLPHTSNCPVHPKVPASAPLNAMSVRFKVQAFKCLSAFPLAINWNQMQQQIIFLLSDSKTVQQTLSNRQYKGKRHLRECICVKEFSPLHADTTKCSSSSCSGVTSWLVVCQWLHLPRKTKPHNRGWLPQGLRYWTQ